MARGLTVWLLIMLAETVHGVLRGLLLAPRLGQGLASLIAWPVGLALVLGLSVLLIRWTRLSSSRDLLLLGSLWAVLTVGFEVLIGLLRGMGRAEIMAEINPLTGTILYSAAVMLLAPLAASWLRRHA